MLFLFLLILKQAIEYMLVYVIQKWKWHLLRNLNALQMVYILSVKIEWYDDEMKKAITRRKKE